MSNYQRSLISNTHTPNADLIGNPLGRSDLGQTDNGSGSLGHNLNLLPTGGLGLGPTNQMIPLGQPRFNQQVTEVRKTIFTPQGIQIHTVVDIPAPARLPRLNQNPLWDDTLSLRAPPPPFNSLPMMNQQNFMENINLPIPTPNWPTTKNITFAPNVSAGSVHEIEPIRSYLSNNHALPVPQLPYSNMNNQDNLANIDYLLDDNLTTGLLSSGSTSMTTPLVIATKIEPDMVPQHVFDDKVEDPQEMNNEQDEHDDDDDDDDDGRTHSLPHRKNGPYTCPKCNKVFQISQSFASHVLGHYKRETPAERRRRQIAKYKKKGLQVTQSPHGLTVSHNSFKESGYDVGRARNNTNQAQPLRHPQFDLRRPIVRVKEVKEEVDG